MSARSDAEGGGARPRTLVYLCYGDGPHVDETIFSILTAHHHAPPGARDHQVVVYTDQPARFAALDAQVHALGEGELRGWTGPNGYAHRIKPAALLHALRRHGGDVVLVDSDTYFRGPPARVFERVGPGRSVLHVMEGRLLESRTPVDAKLSRTLGATTFVDRRGEPLVFARNERMWNSGVIGVSAEDAELIEDALWLLDQLAAATTVHHTEQFAVGYALRSQTIRECRDVVFHYWPSYLRDTFRRRLPGLSARLADLPLSTRARRAYAARPRPPLSRLAKVRLREGLRRLGVPFPGTLKSA